MPFASHFRLTCSGVLGDVALVPERFTFGVNLALAGGTGGSGNGDAGFPDREITDAGFDDVVADTVAFFGRVATLISSHATLTEVKWATIGADGKYLRDPRIAAVSQVGGVAAGGTVMPPQVALAVSLNSERRGASGKGRFYLPAPAAEVFPTDLLMAPADAQSVAGSAAQWLNDLNNQPSFDQFGLGVTIASTKGFNTAVSSVRVGRVVDTIRTRRRSLAESYGAPVVLAGNPD